MFHDVNQTDIMAALKVWILTVAKDLDIEVDPNPNIQPSIEAMVRFAENNHVSGFAVLATEMFELSRHFSFDKVSTSENRGILGDKYIVLVRDDSDIHSVSQLNGEPIVFYKNAHMDLGTVWLETLLLEKNHETIEEFFSIQTFETKPAQVVLPVFFGKKTACLITKNTFEVMGELNPQLGQQLRILEQSPVLLSAGFVFIKQEVNTGYRDEVIEAMTKLSESEAGKQLLSITQANMITTLPVKRLEESFDLIRKHKRLLKQRK